MSTARIKKRKSIVSNETDRKSVSPAQCVKDFLKECLDVRNGKLRILCCLPQGACYQKGTVKNHISSEHRHKNRKEK